MKLADFLATIDGALQEVAHGQIVNATGFTGQRLEAQLRADFNLLIELETTIRKIAIEKSSKGLLT